MRLRLPWTRHEETRSRETAERRPPPRHGTTWLTRPRWWTDSRWRAARSPFQWIHRDGAYELSLLGILNGVLPRIPIWRPVLVAIVDEDTLEIRGYRLRRRWW